MRPVKTVVFRRIEQGQELRARAVCIMESVQLRSCGVLGQPNARRSCECKRRAKAVR